MRSEDPSIIRCFPYPAYLSLHWFLRNVCNEIRCISISVFAGAPSTIQGSGVSANDFN